MGPDPLQQRMLDALADGDGRRLLERVPRDPVLPSSMLVGARLQIGPRWGDLEQGFALTFNGYAHCADVQSLLDRAEAAVASGGDLTDWPVDDLRAGLFALQRTYRDAWDAPDEALVAALPGAIRAALDGGKGDGGN